MPRQRTAADVGARPLLRPPLTEHAISMAYTSQNMVSPISLQQLKEANAQRQARAVVAAKRALAVLNQVPYPKASTEEAIRVLRLRVDHPAMSLRQLAQLHEPALTKDTYAARLRRAIEVADEIQARKARGGFSWGMRCSE